jgi:excisionase family DNA binding protein
LDKPKNDPYSTEDTYITTGEAAKILRVSPKTVARWAKDGRIPHILTLGGHRRFPRSAVDEVARRTTVF